MKLHFQICYVRSPQKLPRRHDSSSYSQAIVFLMLYATPLTALCPLCLRFSQAEEKNVTIFTFPLQ